MLRKLLTLATLSLFMIAAQAAPPKPSAGAAGLGPQDPDMLSAHPEVVRMRKASGPTAEDVGDVDSFGRAKTYLGVQQTQTVFLAADCSGFPPEAFCVELPATLSDTTSVDEFGTASFNLPGKSTESLICFTVNNFTSWSWQNTSGASEFAVMTVNPTFQIESDVLNGLTDASTGLPFNGELFPDGPRGLSTYFEFRSLDPGEFQFVAPRDARVCTGGLVSTRVLTETHGLTDNQAKDFFKEPITISFGVRGNISSVTDASFSYGIRLYGD